MSYRNDVDALAARRDALAYEVEHAKQQLAETEQLLAEANRRARLPILDNIRVAAPCKADWAKMSGDERVRHCGDCKKDVFNISDLTRAEAEALIAAKNGELCVRYYRRADGTILLADCEIGAKRQRRKVRLVAAGAAALLAGGVAGAMLMRGGTQAEEHAVMGVIAPEPIGEHVAGGATFEPPPVIEHELSHEAPSTITRSAATMGGIDGNASSNR